MIASALTQFSELKSEMPSSPQKACEEVVGQEGPEPTAHSDLSSLFRFHSSSPANEHNVSADTAATNSTLNADTCSASSSVDETADSTGNVGQRSSSFDISSMFNNNNEKTGSPLTQISQQFNFGAASPANLATNSFGSQLGFGSSLSGGFGCDPSVLLQFNQLFQQQPTQSSMQVHAKSEEATPNNPPRKSQPSSGRGSSRVQDSGDKKRSYPYTFQYCVLCTKNVHSSKLPCHIRQCHVSKPMFQCPACDFTSTYSKNNVKSHMVSLHGLAGEPISYMDQYAGQVEEFMKKCFPNVRGRGRPVHGRTSPMQQQNNTVANAAAAQAALQAQIQAAQQAAQGRGKQQKQKIQNPPALPALNSVNLSDMCMAMFQNNAKLLEKKPYVSPGSTGGLFSCVPQLNPFSYFQNFGYLNQFMNGYNNTSRLSGAPVKDDPASAPPVLTSQQGEQVTMEQLLQGFGAFTPQQLNSGISIPAFNNFFPGSQKTSVGSACRSESSSAAPCEAKEDVMEVDVVENKFSEDPKYLPKSINMSVLSKQKTKGTVFANLENTSHLLDQLDLQEVLLKDFLSLLTEEQSKKVLLVREKLQLQAFEVLFAIHRLDLDVLPLAKVELVLSIAPTDVDRRRFAALEQSSQCRSLSEEDDFVLQLARIDRLRDKLELMRFMGRFEKIVSELRRKCQNLRMASQFLMESTEFHQILHILLVAVNLVNGQISTDVIPGFKITSLEAISSYKLPNDQSLLEFLSDRIQNQFPHLKSFVDNSKLLEVASEVDFSGIQAGIAEMERGMKLLEAEQKSGSENDALKELVTRVEEELSHSKSDAAEIKVLLQQLLDYFGESSDDESVDEPQVLAQSFFKEVSQFCCSFQSTLHELNM